MERGTTRGTVRLAIMGLGSRGASVYADYVERHPDDVALVAAADPQPHRLAEVAARHGLPAAACFADYRELAGALPGLGVDAVVVALPDAEHVEAVELVAPLGRPVLVEKPVAPSAVGLARLVGAVGRGGCPVVVAHVLRYTPFFRTVRAVLDDGVLGSVRTIRLEENIGFWHFAHSYVRGNWRRVGLSSPMILAKSCHDLDLLRWFAGAAPVRVASNGGLAHFHAGNAPVGAPARCLDGCPVADGCPFYAPRYYVEALADRHGPPVSMLGPDTSAAGRLRALATGPYGRCVYHCDNDVADHQQVLVSFANGVTGVLTTSAFTAANTRTIQVTCTAGEISGRMDTGDLDVHLYSPTARLRDLPADARLLSETRTGRMGHRWLRFDTRPAEEDEGDHRGHAGGDEGLLDRFVDAVRAGTLGGAAAATLETSLEASLDSHRMAFAAERARLEGTVVDLT